MPAEGFELRSIEIGGLNRVGMRRKLATLPASFHNLGCFRLLRGVSAVFSMGGYAAGPPVMAALLRRIPVVVMEPNAVPGFTNRVIGRFVRRALVSFPETARYFPQRQDRDRRAARARGVLSHSAQAALRRAAHADYRRQPGIANAEPSGAAELAAVPRFRACRCGSCTRPARAVRAAARRVRRSGLPGEVAPFIDDMPAAFAEADLVVCRSGAGAVSELAAAGKPSVLVPFPFAADDHQTRNAEAMERAGAARLVRTRR